MDGSMPPRTCVKGPRGWLPAAGAAAVAAAGAAAGGAARLAAGASPPFAGTAEGAPAPPPQAPSRSPNTITRLADQPRISDLLPDQSAIAPTLPSRRLASRASARALSVVSRGGSRVAGPPASRATHGAVVCGV